jgi:hypothetical protein
MHTMSLSAKGAVDDLESVCTELFACISIEDVNHSVFDSIAATGESMQGKAMNMNAKFERLMGDTKSYLELTS